MKPISLAVLIAVLATGLATGCATTGPTATAKMPYEVGYAGVGPRAEEDPTYSLGNPFRGMAALLYPVGLFLQRVVEVPYAVAMRIDPTLYGLTEYEQQYLQQRWGVRPGPNPDAPPSEPATK